MAKIKLNDDMAYCLVKSRIKNASSYQMRQCLVKLYMTLCAKHFLPFVFYIYRMDKLTCGHPPV